MMLMGPLRRDASAVKNISLNTILCVSKDCSISANTTCNIASSVVPCRARKMVLSYFAEMRAA